MLAPCSMTGSTQPRITSSMAALSNEPRAGSAASTVFARWSGVASANAPSFLRPLPRGVRTAS
jgi:hypothetical protein